MAESQTSVLQLNEESEGTTEYTDEYIFQQIGSSLPLNPTSSTFDLSDLPTQALAVSQISNNSLIFLANSSGFYVVRTKDAMEAAKLSKEKKESCSCIQELSVVDVKIGKVRILAVSKDSLTLAAVVGVDVYFYSTVALLNKEQQPSYRCSIDDASYVKDFKWRKKLKNSFIVLSSDGKLYHGDLESPLKEVMKNVDAVDWSVEGNFIAVAKENSIIICSSRFQEKFTLSMPFGSRLKVDSINWIRQDCIALGCLNISDDKKEDGYVIQLISSKEGNISKGSSKPVVLSFNEVFYCIDDEIVPSGHGPYLFLNYLEHREIALLANKKSTDNHIVLFHCSLDADEKEPALIAFSQDKYLPRIPIQENEDDNLIMGFGVDTTSLYEKVQVTLGIEQKELSPYCILLCLTLDEKLLMFYVAGQTESPNSRKVESEISDETSSEEVETEEDGHVDEIQIKDPNDLGVSVHAGDVSNRESTSFLSMPIQSAGPHQDKLQPHIRSTELNTNDDLLSSTERQQNANLPSSNLSKSSEPPSKSFGSESSLKDFRKPEAQKPAFSSSGTLGFTAFGGSTPSIFHPTSKSGNDGTSNVFPSNLQKEDFLSSSSSAHSSNKTSPSEELNSRPSSSIVDKVEQPTYRLQSPLNVTGANTPSVLPRNNILTSKDTDASSKFPSNASSHIGGLRPVTQNSVEPKLQPTGNNLRTAQSSYGMGSEREFSKHFGNVNEMSKELDNLLLQIEGEGGYRDTCIIFHRNSVLGIEQGLEDLSKRCRAWKGVMEDQLEGIQNLLDQTVQVLSKKIYIERIVKQASDTQYWDLWNRQKLTPELELKRRQILKVNQNLTSQLIELERHFNTLELNKFGDSNEVLSARRGFHTGSKPSRDGQAFHRLYNTMSSQLAVAEQLSESLTKQMKVLNIESPAARRKSVAKELFESIGLSYEGDSFKSPSTKKTLRSPDSVKNIQFSSVSAATKDHSRRNQSSVVKSFEPETARRRVSLDRSWASFEPPKTTVKRMLLQEERPTMTATKPSLMTNKEGLKLSSPVSYPKNRSQFEVDNVVQDRAPTNFPSTSSINMTGKFSGKSQSTGMKSPELQLQQRDTQRDKLVSPPVTLNKPNQSSSGFSFSKSDNSIMQAKPLSNAKSNLHSESKLNQTSPNLNFTPPQVPVLSKETPKMSDKIPPNLNSGGTREVKATSSAFSLSSSPVFDFQRKSSQSEIISKEAHLPQKKSSQSETVSKETQSGVSTISPPTFTVTPPTKPSISEPAIPSSIPPSSSSSLSTFKSDATGKPSMNDKLPTAPSFLSSSFSTPSISPAIDFKLITPPVEPKPTVTDLNVKPDASSSLAPPLQPQPIPAAPATSGFLFNNVMANAKSEAPAVATQEDEMEEEAPDVNLGGFGGFGLGSAPTTSATPKPNPFGGFLNTSPNPSPFNLSVPSGELFKPASFNVGQTFQPSQPATQTAFGSSFTPPEPTRSAFGQPAQIGVGQQALGSMLGSFGQSRQIGVSPPGTGFGGGGAGFGTPPTGGFAGAAASGGGGFAKAASAGGGFAAIASSGGGGFAGVGSAGGGGFGAFGNQQQGSGGSGFGGAASGGGGFGAFGNQPSGSGGGFGSFGNQQGSGGFSAFGGGPTGVAPGNPLITQMRK